MAIANLSAQVNQFQADYDAKAKDLVWQQQSQRFRKFWNERVISDGPGEIPESECDEIIRILDRNGKGNTKDSDAVARAMVPQGAWRRMFNEFRTKKKLGDLVWNVLEAESSEQRAKLIDKLYEINAGRANNLTGPSGNTINAFLAAYDPMENLSIISLKDRRAIIDFLEVPVSLDWESASIGQRIVGSHTVLIDGLRALGLSGSARTLSRFCYYPPVRALWKGDHLVKTPEKTISVIVPMASEVEAAGEADATYDVRESMQIQATLATIGTSLGLSIWLPKADRGRVLKHWTPKPGELLDDLPLGYDTATMKTIEQIDVLWLKKRSIVRAFEVEHTTSVYSGLLRMADLIALQQNLNIKLHIVAPLPRREKVMQEIRRPVFSMLEGRELSEMCTFISYDSVRELAQLKHLDRMTDKVLEDYEEAAESDDS
jgi:hypothetical protein